MSLSAPRKLYLVGRAWAEARLRRKISGERSSVG